VGAGLVIDLDELAVGQELPPLQLPPITRTTLALFAGASGDHNPIHIDIDAAHAAGESDVFAHGMLSMAYLGTLLTGQVPQGQLRTWTVRFSARTPVHAQVTCRATVQAVSGSAQARQVVLDVMCELTDGTVTLRGTATLSTDPSIGDATDIEAGQ
jgi:acyl dehydratase